MIAMVKRVMRFIAFIRTAPNIPSIEGVGHDRTRDMPQAIDSSLASQSASGHERAGSEFFSKCLSERHGQNELRVVQNL
jgi:hypothetical protein